MKFRCRRELLHRAIQSVGGVVDPRNIKPILQDICFRVQEGCLQLAATDLEVGITHCIEDIDVEEAGGLVIPAQAIAAILRESPDEELTLATEGNVCRVSGVDSWFRLRGEPTDDFPEVPSFPEGKALEVDGLVLREMVQKTRFAVAPVRSTYALNGALWVMEEGKKDIELVGADGRRLARVRRKAATAAVASARAIVPVKALAQIEKMVAPEEARAGDEAEEGNEAPVVGRVRISLEERRILAAAGNTVLAAQLVDGRYPDYVEVIPKDCDKSVEFQRLALLSAVRRAALMTTRDARAVTFALATGKLTLRAEEAQQGEAEVVLPIAYQGPETNIVFNPDFLIDMLRVCEEESVILEFKSANSACIFKTSGDYVYLVMPITREDT